MIITNEQAYKLAYSDIMEAYYKSDSLFLKSTPQGIFFLSVKWERERESRITSRIFSVVTSRHRSLWSVMSTFWNSREYIFLISEIIYRNYLLLTCVIWQLKFYSGFNVLQERRVLFLCCKRLGRRKGVHNICISTNVWKISSWGLKV